jgi:hypothetical protein
LREENKLTVSKKRVPRRIVEPKRDVIIGGWNKLQNEEVHKLSSFKI